MTIVGGLRTRLMADSIRVVLQSGLGAIGWFDSNRSHAPVRLIAMPNKWDDPVLPNLVAVTARAQSADDIELGSILTRTTTLMRVELYAQNDSLAVELSNDIRDIIRGRHTAGPHAGTIPILDLRQATPAPIGWIMVSNVQISREPPSTGQAHSLTWVAVEFNTEDAYYDTLESP